jgi:polar amino acid transport system substrate-binding protein
MVLNKITRIWKKINSHLLTVTCLLLLTGITACVSGNLEPAPSPPPIGSISSFETNTLRYAVFPAPPYMIGAGDENSSLSGIDVEIVQEIARRLHLKVEYIRCTWVRCLELMNDGQADLLSSAYKKPDREAYMQYFDQPFLEELPIAFYYLKEKHYSVNNYEDIYQFTKLGVLNGASYFERFDQDARVKKFEVTSQDQLFPMLLAGRLDAIAGYLPTENYRIIEQGIGSRIERSTYEYHEKALVYMTISKKSFLSGRLKEINQINQQLLDEGFIARVINAYYEKYR